MIQRKLAILDAVCPQLPLRDLVTRACPLLLPSLGLIAGILLRHGIALPAAVPVCGLLLLSVLVIAVGTGSPAENRGLYLAGLTGMAFACLGVLRLNSGQRSEPGDMRALVTDGPRMVTLRGIVDSDPFIEQANWTFAPVHHLEPATTFDLRTEALFTARGWQPVRATVRVRIAEPVNDLQPLQRIELYGWLDRFGPASNPGQFDMTGHLARQDIHLWVSVKSRLGMVRLASTQRHACKSLHYALCRRANQALLAGLPASVEIRGLVQALVLGHRRDIGADTYMAFKKTGLLHFISLSGLHMGILVALVWWTCRIAGLLKRGRAAVCLCIITLFICVVPARAPTLRAAIICWVFCLSFFFQRRPHPLNTLCLAALILLLARPAQVFDAGWQLSFASVLGILILAQPLYDRLLLAVARIRMPASWTWLGHPALHSLGQGTLSLLCVGLGAWLGGAGILLWHFYRITPVACVWTVLVFPVVAVILILAFVKILVYLCLPCLGLGLGGPLGAGVQCLVALVKAIDGLGRTCLLVGHTPAGWILCYYVMLFAIRYPPMRTVRNRGRLRWCLAAALLCGTFAQRYLNQHRSDLLLTCLDVGHGQAAVLQLPGKQTLLFDAGSLYRRDIGTRVVVPFLEYQGIDRLDQVVLSHNDTDHLNGIPEIVGHTHTDHIRVPLAFSREDQAGLTLATLRQGLRRSGLQLETLETVIPTEGDARVRVLWPTEACLDRPLTDNDRSLVVLIAFAGRVLLICSDIEQTAQKDLLALYPDLDVDVLVAPHHGSLTTLSPAFLACLRPEMVVCSCSASQWRKKRVIQAQAGIEVMTTAEHGAVTIRVDPAGRIETGAHLKNTQP